MKVRCLYSGLLLVGLVATSCGGDDGEDVVEKSSFQMPIRENTWVRKETVRKTKDDFFSAAGKKIAAIPVDPTVVAKLKTPAQLSVNTQKECAQQANALDKKRTEVQKRGGLWHAYERTPQTKPYSDYGMQLDSQTNRLVFSLKHLCENIRGFRLSGWGAATVRKFKSMDKQSFRNYFLELGEAPADVDNWIRFAEFSIQRENRKIPVAKISESLAKAQPLVNLYEDLARKKITDASTAQTFLAQGASLLSVINENFATDPQIILALQDEAMHPFESLKGEM